MSVAEKSRTDVQSTFMRQFPYSLEAEQAVIGSIILDAERISQVTEIIKAEDFYVDKHREIYTILQSMYLESRSIDLITLLNNLVTSGSYNEDNAKNYVKQLCEMVPAVSNIVDYAKIVRDKALLRRLITVSEEISESAYQDTDDVTSLVDSAESKVFALTQGMITSDFASIHDVILEYYNELDLIMNDPEAANGTPTYYRDLDKLLVGMGKGDLVLIGARPGMGKTSFALNIASQVAMHQKKSVAIFSLEMSSTQLVGRMLSSEARIDSYKLRKGNISPEEFQALAKAATALSKTQIYIDDSTDVTVTRMKAKLRRIKNLGLIVIDYLQLMQSDRHIDNRVVEVADISRNLKILAKEFGVPVITCAQLSRGPESRQSKKPMLSDLRDSGAIEQDADIVLFLYRDEYYKDSGDESAVKNENIAEVIVAKNRHGAVGTVKMGWEGQYTRFTTLDNTYEEN
ncbi:MAG: replicative DNA helicase [Ruminococcaceae bacterium]|nr:replicative DNA helicase [Oscillospiraceae bacterium]